MEPITAMHAIEAWPHLNDARMWAFFPKLRPKSLKELRAMYGRWENPLHAEGEVRENWACRDRSGGQLVGTMQATTFPEPAVSYIAYGIFAAYQRQGYAREAISAVLQHLREDLHIRRILAEMAVGNESSFKLVESLGFKRVRKQNIANTELGLDGDEYVYELVI